MHQHKEACKHNAYLIKPDQIMSTFKASKFFYDFPNQNKLCDSNLILVHHASECILVQSKNNQPQWAFRQWYLITHKLHS